LQTVFPSRLDVAIHLAWKWRSRWIATSGRAEIFRAALPPLLPPLLFPEMPPNFRADAAQKTG
jgi:hypothetical protein